MRHNFTDNEARCAQNARSDNHLLGGAKMNDLHYSNPVWSGYCADPFVLKHDNFYYCYGTASSTPEQDLAGRHFALLRSPNLIDWEFLGGALEAAPGYESAAFWAPEIAFANGQFWMYYSASIGDDSNHRLHVAVSDTPLGPFRDCAILLEKEGFCIDASPFHDPQSGKWFLYFAKDFFENRVGTGTAVVELGSDMQSTLGQPQIVVVASADWQIYQRNRFHYEKNWEAWHTVEGPFVVWRDGQYVCFFSGGNWQNESYGVGYAIADNPLGPWRVPNEGASVLRGVADVIGPGHNSVVLAPDGEQMCVYHAWNEERTQRQLCINPIEWTANGPHVTPTKMSQ